MSPSVYIYQQFIAHALTLCELSVVFTVILIWIVQSYLQLLLCPVISIIAIHFCMVSRTLTSQGFKCIQNRLGRLVTKSPPFTRGVPPLYSRHWLPVRFRILLNINLLTNNTLHRNSLFIVTPCLLHHSHTTHWDRTKIIICRSLGSRPTQVQELFTLVLRLFGTTCHCLSAQPFQLLSWKTSKDTPLGLGLPP